MNRDGNLIRSRRHDRQTWELLHRNSIQLSETLNLLSLPYKKKNTRQWKQKKVFELYIESRKTNPNLFYFFKTLSCPLSIWLLVDVSFLCLPSNVQRERERTGLRLRLQFPMWFLLKKKYFYVKGMSSFGQLIVNLENGSK